MSNVVLFNIFLILACGYALARGTAAARATAVLFLSAALATRMAQRPGWWTDWTLQLWNMAIDAALFAALAVIVLRTPQRWPIGLAVLQGFAVLVHAAQLYKPEIVPWMYHWAANKIAYPMLAILVLGVWLNRGVRASRTPSAI